MQSSCRHFLLVRLHSRFNKVTKRLRLLGTLKGGQVAKVGASPYDLSNQVIPFKTMIVSKHQPSIGMTLRNPSRKVGKIVSTNMTHRNTELIRPPLKAIEMPPRHGHGHHVGIHGAVAEGASELQYGSTPILVRQLVQFQVWIIAGANGNCKLVAFISPEPFGKDLSQHAHERVHAPPKLLVRFQPLVLVGVEADEFISFRFVHNDGERALPDARLADGIEHVVGLYSL
mmetsp:Transcript_37394/g.78868  ORF Transcript_37394/g.78868 Transcript_37394/m.78868 type:complete len:229 (-) Transcript_37394:558-1244(-)